MKRTFFYGGMVIVLFLIYSGIKLHVPTIFLSTFDVVLTLLLTIVLIYSVIAWVSTKNKTHILYLAVSWSGLIFLGSGFIPLGLLLFPLLLILATNEVLRENYHIADPDQTSSLSSIYVTTPILNSDYPINRSIIKSIFKSIGLFLLFPAIVFLVYALSLTALNYFNPDFWSINNTGFSFLTGYSVSGSSSTHPFRLIFQSFPATVSPRLILFLIVAGLALRQLGSRPMYFYLSSVPFLSLFLSSFGQVELGDHAAPDLIFTVSVLTTLISAGFLTDRVVRWFVAPAIVLSLSFLLFQVIQSSDSSNLITRERLLLHNPFVSRQLSNETVKDSGLQPGDAQEAVTSLSNAVPIESDATTEVSSGYVFNVNWKEEGPYFFEVKVVNRTSDMVFRNHRYWLEKDETGFVTLVPQYREGRFIQWLLGVGRYATYSAAAAAIHSERGEDALKDAYIQLHNSTDFRVFGDAPDYDPSKPGYTLLLGTFSSRREAELASQAWSDIGMRNVGITADNTERQYRINTGRYNDRSQARLLAEFATRKTGLDVHAIPLHE